MWPWKAQAAGELSTSRYRAPHLRHLFLCFLLAMSSSVVVAAAAASWSPVVALSLICARFGHAAATALRCEGLCGGRRDVGAERSAGVGEEELAMA